MSASMDGLNGPSGRRYPMSARTLYTQEQLWSRLRQTARQIAADYATCRLTVSNPLVLVCVLKGSLWFTADLSRFLADEAVPIRLECLCVSSYGSGVSSSGEVRLLLDVRESVEQRHVLLVEDIVDSATTLVYLKTLFENRRPASLKTIALIDKPEARSGVKQKNKKINNKKNEQKNEQKNEKKEKEREEMEQRCREFRTDYTVLEVPNVFVIGYGMDYAEAYRELRDVVVLKPEYYQSKI